MTTFFGTLNDNFVKTLAGFTVISWIADARVNVVFLLVTVAFFMFVGTFMDAVPAMILFVPIILPSATSLGISPIILGLIIIVTLALGLVTPPYGLCLLIASSISGITIEDAFKGTLPYFLSSCVVLLLLVFFPNLWLAIPATLFPGLF